MWDDQAQAVWWLDIVLPSRIHRLVPATGEHRTWHFSVMVTAMALRQDGTMLVGGEEGLGIFDPQTGALTLTADPEHDRPGNRGNDGACDARGRFWFGTMQQNIAPDGADLPITGDTGALYRIGIDGSSQRMEDNIGVSNGPCWSPDGRIFYFSDSRAQIIYAYDFDPDEGLLSNRRIFSDTRDYGYPDGAAVDAEGFLWSARWEGSCVLRFAPDGRIDRIVETPARRPTCVCFGGRGLDVMFLTSSRIHVPAEEIARNPLQGGLFCFNPGVKGLPKHRYGG
jgi:sugar lactone lactonase YvrE